MSAGHSNPTLLALEQLCRTLTAGATEDERQAWWHIVERVQSYIDSDSCASKAEQGAMRRLRERVTDVYRAINDGYDPSFSGAMAAAGGLQMMLEARTTGFDGHRLR
jgi:hypothetical protein